MDLDCTDRTLTDATLTQGSIDDVELDPMDEGVWAQSLRADLILLARVGDINERYHQGVETIRALRERAGMSQRDLARATGIAQPNLAAYEAGRRPTTDKILERVRIATSRRPSTVLAARRGDLLALLEREGIVDVRVFGSVARGTDHAESDLDLLVESPRGTSLLDVVRLEREVSELLGIPVDLVSIGALEGRFGERVRREMVPVAS